MKDEENLHIVLNDRMIHLWAYSFIKQVELPSECKPQR
jgi:hypothetical protein